MKNLLTVIEKRDYVNDFTKELDTILKHKVEGVNFNTYLYPYSDDIWVFRYPGATRGHIKIDDNDIITDIKIYEDTNIYKPEAEEICKKYIGYKLTFAQGLCEWNKYR